MYLRKLAHCILALYNKSDELIFPPKMLSESEFPCRKIINSFTFDLYDHMTY